MLDQIVNGFGTDIGSLQATVNVESMLIQQLLVPLLMMGNLLWPLPSDTKCFANGSSRYPTSTALSLETLASWSVCWTILLFANFSSPILRPDTKPPRPRPRPRPVPRWLRRLLRFGTCGAAIIKLKRTARQWRGDPPTVAGMHPPWS